MGERNDGKGGGGKRKGKEEREERKGGGRERGREGGREGGKEGREAEGGREGGERKRGGMGERERGREEGRGGREEKGEDNDLSKLHNALIAINTNTSLKLSIISTVHLNQSQDGKHTRTALPPMHCTLFTQLAVTGNCCHATCN